MTAMELNPGSSGSLKNSSTCTGGCSSTAFGSGFDRTSKACAETVPTAHALNSRTITISQTTRRLALITRGDKSLFPPRSSSLPKRHHSQHQSDEPDQYAEIEQPVDHS